MKNARMSVASELGSSKGVQEPMRYTTPRIQEGIGSQIIEYKSKIKQIALGGGPVAYQACESPLAEGRQVVVYAYRPSGEPAYQLGYITRATGESVPSEQFTLCVRDLIVAGRICRCSDQATQSSWPVLIAPTIRAVTPAASQSLQWLADERHLNADDTTPADPHHYADPQRNDPPSLIEQVLRARIDTHATALRAADTPCGGAQR